MSQSRIKFLFNRLIKSHQPRLFSKVFNSFNSLQTNNGLSRLAAGVGAGMTLGCSGLYFSSPRQEKNFTVDKPATLSIVISIGSILNLDYQATIAAFNQLAQQYQVTLRLGPLQFAEILTLDDLFRHGSLSAEQFRAGVIKIINVPVNDAEFDFAWNAMLGDTNILNKRLTELNRLPAQIILVSNTNPIHAQRLGLAQLNQPVFLSYEQNCLGYLCYEKLFHQFALTANNTIVVLGADNLTSPSVASRNARDSQLVRQWAGAKNVALCKCASTSSLADDVYNCLLEFRALTEPAHAGPSLSPRSRLPLR